MSDQLSHVIEAMCKAYWPGWDQMSQLHKARWRVKMFAVYEVVKEALI